MDALVVVKVRLFNECAELADRIAANAEERAKTQLEERKQITRCLVLHPFAAMRRAKTWREAARKFRILAKLSTLTTKEAADANP